MAVLQASVVMWGELDEEAVEVDDTDVEQDESGHGNAFWNSDNGQNETNSTTYSGDPILLNIIELLHYKRRLLNLQNCQANNQSSLPDIPEFRSISNGVVRADSRIPEDQVHDLLRKSMASLVSFVGFDDIADDALELLTDIAAGCLNRMSMLIQLLNTREETQFQMDPISHAFKLLGISSPVVLLEDYNQRVREYQKRLCQECKKLKKDIEQNGNVESDQSNQTDHTQ